MSDWRTYDEIAGSYEDRCTARFEEASRRLLALSEPGAARRMLDLGTGTGAVLSALGERGQSMTLVAGCDRSVPMLRTARRRVPVGRFVAGDVTRLPFRDAAFELVTANCVLSHVRNVDDALLEARRVLVEGGTIATSSWGTAADPYGAAWSDLLAEAIGSEAARSAFEQVVPSEAELADPENVRCALERTGFQGIRVAVARLPVATSVREYVAERLMNAGSRLARHTLGEGRWLAFTEHAEMALRQQFGVSICYERALVVARASVP